MKWAAIFLVVVLAFLIILAILKGDGALQAGMKASFTQGVKLLPILLIAFFIAGFVEVLLPPTIEGISFPGDIATVISFDILLPSTSNSIIKLSEPFRFDSGI